MNIRNLDDEKISEVEIAIENQHFEGTFLVNNKVDEIYINPLRIKFDDLEEMRNFVKHCEWCLTELEKQIKKY